MIRLFYYLIILLPSFSFAQQNLIPKNEAGNYEYTEVVNVDSATAEQLYSRAKIFVVNAFKSGKEVTQLNDDATKTVAGNGSDKINYKGLNGLQENVLQFKFLIECKNGRYRYTISNFELVSVYGGYTTHIENETTMRHISTKGMQKQMFQQMHADMQLLIANLKKSMEAQSKDW